ncbi:hypothetical protein KQI77_10280 [Clostridium sp. MSJ-8]|nr:hypothetical protein [Clostridium sp. MSJ-8]MBU5488517.1 hypothetical protein [Clostridium sp. MSJ-8]
MREHYNSFSYWEDKINKNKTIRGHMFMKNPPDDKSIYVHTLIFTKKNGIENIFAYFPSVKALLGYIQYSFLQEAFYTWINGREEAIVNVPSMTVEKIVKDGIKKGDIKKSVGKLMQEQYDKINSLWSLSDSKIVQELKKFARNFNKTWFGDNREFLYIKILKDVNELQKFVMNSALMIGGEDEFKEKVGLDLESWKNVCEEAITNKDMGERFRDILQNNLTEII